MKTHRKILEARRAELRHRLGLTPIPASDRSADQADEIVAREARLLHFANVEQMRIGLRAVDEALDRLHAGTYGICVTCEEPIPAGRLRAVPEAARCVPCAVAHEKQLGAIDGEPRYQPSRRITDEAGDNELRRPMPAGLEDQPISELEDTGI